MRGGAACERRSGEMAWPACHVEHVLTGRDFSGFQQRFDVGRCRMSKTVSIARSGALPAGMLKGADGGGSKAHSQLALRKLGHCGIQANLSERVETWGSLVTPELSWTQNRGAVHVSF